MNELQMLAILPFVGFAILMIGYVIHGMKQ